MYLVFVLASVELIYDLPELFFVQLDIKVDLFLKGILMVLVIVVLEHLNLLEFDEQAQLHLVDLVLAFD